ncbi:MAG: YggS family pyridoxal phosphate-dependent enzyme [Clostridiaceae bacterium]|nr:YggS family pyridoxal phosphate-dependent enzyme [Clostridiaceae bacterium]
MSLERKNELSTNIQEIRKEIDQLALAANRNPQDISLICVSKNYGLEDILLANEIGATEFGENRVQELQEKQIAYAGLTDEEQKQHQINWHFIGTLQRNKVKDIVGKVKLIHSVHSTKLIKQISRVSVRFNVSSEILLQVNVAHELSKQGFYEDQLEPAINLVLNSPNLCLRGLMTMAPYFSDPADAEPIFAETKKLLTKYQPLVGPLFDQLSMGMSNDYQYAIAQGATLIRIGTRIFGVREYN